MAEIVAFYSYKGGVGRSLSLANVAALLASQGRRVACVDFDLEAGGLHTIFGLELNDIRYTLLDLLTMINPPDVRTAMSNLTGLLPHTADGGELWLLPTVSEAEKVLEVLDGSRDLSMLLGTIINQIIDQFNPHFVLVDSRSGFAELASASILKANSLVCVLRPNRQNADGLRILLDILDTIGERPMPFLVLSQVPDVSDAVPKINKLQEMLGGGRQFNARIPYDPSLALEENVVAITAPRSSLAHSYQPIVEWLQTRIV